jgi:thiol-disulfide isomerase/thioredoxin
MTISTALKLKELWYFYADWCPYCQQQNPIMDEFEKENPDITVIRIESKDSDAAEINNVTAFPTHKVVIDGMFIDTLNGLKQKEDLVKAFKKDG